VTRSVREWLAVLATTGAAFAQPFLRWPQVPAVPLHLAAHEPEQAAVEGGAAMTLAGGVTGSRRVARRLRKLDTEAARYGEVPAVRAFRARLAART
jgi:hypothetical protein